jgi:type VI secretion system protein ImpK
VKGPALSRAAGEVFAAGLLFQAAPESARPAPAVLRNQLLGLLDAVSQSAAGQQAAGSDLDAARFALTAWLDEVISVSGWQGSVEWEREPLQLALFGTRRAGVEFFDRLNKLRPENAAALEVFFHCLALGFQGDFAGREGDRLAVVHKTLEKLRRVERGLELSREKQLTPAAYQVDIELAPRGSRLLPLLLLGAGGLFALFGVLWGVLYLLAGRVPVLEG